MEEQKFDLAKMKKVGMIQQKQNEFFVMRLRAVGGDLTAKQLKKISEVAEKYAKGEVHLSTRQGVEIHNVHYTKLERARLELEKADIRMGACGPRVRVIVACPGAATCKWGIVDTKQITHELDARYFRKDTPHKFKMSVTGCPHNCAKATENDIGLMGSILPSWVKDKCINCDLCVSVCPTNAIYKEEGAYKLNEDKCIYCSICTSLCPVGTWTVIKKGCRIFIGGTMGKIPRLATPLVNFMKDKDKIIKIIDKALKYYQDNGRKKERFGHMIDRIGFDRVKEGILDGI